MTPKQFHQACYDAICECPQFSGYDDDTEFEGVGEFGKIHKKGWGVVIRFWKDHPILWGSGYSECLPPEVLSAFEKAERIFDQAIKKAMEDSK